MSGDSWMQRVYRVPALAEQNYSVKVAIWNINLLEELTDSQLIIKFVIIFGTPIFLLYLQMPASS